MKQKQCFKCNETKPLSEFSKHKGMADGHLGKCKQCAIEYAKKHRLENLESVRAYDRKRGNRQSKEYSKHYRKNNPEKYKAHNAVNNAIRDGKLKKGMCCEECGEIERRLHAHHDNYSKPLQVKWLCPGCHKQHHENR